MRLPYVILALTGLGCTSSECTDIGCIDTVAVAVNASSGMFPLGRYSVDGLVDGRAVRVDCEVTATANNCGFGGPISLSRRDGSRLDISLTGAPQLVDLTLRYDGNMIIAQTSFSPEYRTIAPNGTACGPVCKQASHTMTATVGVTADGGTD